MSFYQFTLSADSASARKRAEIAKAITEAHCKTTGAPADFVSCSFVEIPSGGLRVPCAPQTRRRSGRRLQEMGFASPRPRTLHRSS